MDILGIIREWVEIRQSRKDHCKSCIILLEQLNNANTRERRLLDMLTRIPETVEKPQEVVVPQPLISGAKRWKETRAILEAEDRARAAAMRAAKEVKKDTEISINELEQELAIGGDV